MPTFTQRMEWATPTSAIAIGTNASGSHGRRDLRRDVRLSVIQDVSPQLTLFAEAFPASRTRSLADVPAPTMRATSGPNSPDSFASVDPDGSWRKTCQGYSQVTLDGSLARFSETWPRAGMMQSGIVYQRVPSAPLTDATASGSWPTPDARDANPEGYEAGLRRREKYSTWGLQTAVRWPTPSANQQSGVVTGLNGGSGARAKLESLVGRDQMLLMAGGALNPTWVEWLMGYPLGWTVLKDWATRLSRKSRSGSADASSKPRR